MKYRKKIKNIIYKTNHYKKDFKTEESEKNTEVFLWLKNKNYSCRYDSFLLIYELTIKNYFIN